jgi:glycosyltransferase involved in cell wall biosynthesis
MTASFSIIIPLYNKAPYVHKAIESVLSQTFSNWELVIVDDGSTDNSSYVAKSYNDSRIIYIQQDNEGVSTARNNGVLHSHFPYLCFLDADDWWEPTFLEEMSRLIAEFPDTGIYGTNYTIVNETKHKTRVAKIGVDEGFEKGYINYCKAYAKSMYMPLWTGAACVPRNVFDEMHGFPKGIKLGEDFILWIHIALKHKVAFLNKPLAYYNQDVDATTRGVGKLHKPKEHMLWNLSDLEPKEKTDKDYKKLIDNLRVYGLQPYYLSHKYHDAATKELAKVNWNLQPPRYYHFYHRPICLLRLHRKIMLILSSLKRSIISKD